PIAPPFPFLPVSATIMGFVHHQRDQHGRLHSSCERERAQSQRRPGNSSPLGSARHSSTDRNQVRLRCRTVRRLHRSRGGHGNALVFDARVASHRQEHHHH